MDFFHTDERQHREKQHSDMANFFTIVLHLEIGGSFQYLRE